MIAVVIIDDHPIVRDGIAANLEDEPDIAVAGTAAGIDEANALLARVRADVAVVDLELGAGDGNALTRDIIANRKANVVIFSAYAGEERVAAALDAGARGYVLKGTPSEELVRAIRMVAAGETYLSGSVASQAIAALRAPRRLRLTDREREIVELLASGLSNRAIAEKLTISERTVKFHVGEILGRLGANNRTQAVALARERGLL